MSYSRSFRCRANCALHACDAENIADHKSSAHVERHIHSGIVAALAVTRILHAGRSSCSGELFMLGIRPGRLWILIIYEN